MSADEIDRLFAGRASIPFEELRQYLAAVWDAGFDAGERDVFEHGEWDWDAPCIPNPYRDPCERCGLGPVEPCDCPPSQASDEETQ